MLAFSVTDTSVLYVPEYTSQSASIQHGTENPIFIVPTGRAVAPRASLWIWTVNASSIATLACAPDKAFDGKQGRSEPIRALLRYSKVRSLVTL